MQLSQLKDMHRLPSRPMGSKAMARMGNPLTSTIPRLRQQLLTGKLHMQVLTGSLQLVTLPQLPLRLIASLSKGMALLLTIQRLPQLLPHRLLMQPHLLTAPSLPILPTGSSQQILHLQDPRMAASLQRLAKLSLVQQATVNQA